MNCVWVRNLCIEVYAVISAVQVTLSEDDTAHQLPSAIGMAVGWLKEIWNVIMVPFMIRVIN